MPSTKECLSKKAKEIEIISMHQMAHNTYFCLLETNKDRATYVKHFSNLFPSPYNSTSLIQINFIS